MDDSKRRLTIGALSQETSCNIETIRYYERVGVLLKPPRTKGGHRTYSHEHVRRLTFVRRSRELGFSLDEIRGMLNLVEGESYTCAEVKKLSLEHLSDVHDKISDLNLIATVLEELAAKCTGDKLPECPIIDALYEKVA